MTDLRKRCEEFAEREDSLTIRPQHVPHELEFRVNVTTLEDFAREMWIEGMEHVLDQVRKVAFLHINDEFRENKVLSEMAYWIDAEIHREKEGQ